ncbi:unnamed protein product, partial [Heterosigma akashiwo]
MDAAQPSLQQVQHQYDVVMDTLAMKNNKDVEEFRKEFSDIFEALSSSMKNVNSQEAKIEDLRSTYTKRNEEKVNIMRSEEEFEGIKEASLRTVAGLRAQVDERTAAETEKKARVAELQAAIEAAEGERSAGPGWTPVQEARRKELADQREVLARAVDTQTHQLETAKKDVEKLTGLVKDAEEARERVLNKIGEVEGQLAKMRENTAKQNSKKAAAEEKLQALQAETEEGERQLLELTAQVQAGERALGLMDAQLGQAKAEMEGKMAAYDRLCRATDVLKADLEKHVGLNAHAREENDRLRDQVEKVGREKEEAVKAIAAAAGLKEAALRKVQALEAQRQDAEAARDRLKAEAAQLVDVEARAERKRGDVLRRQADDLRREKEILTRKVGGSERAAALVYDLSKVNQNAIKNLHDEIATYKANIKAQRAQVEALVAQRERYEGEVEVYNQQYYTALEEVKLQELQVAELQKRTVAAAARLKQQQNLYEAVRSDRNHYSKELIHSQEEIKEMRRRFKVMNHQIDQLKEEITGKDHALVKEHFDHHHVDKQRESLRNELTKIRKQIHSSEQIILNQKVEIRKLSQIIQEADEEKQRQQKEHDAVVGERDLLGAQLIKRNEELGALYEKIKVQRSQLHHGEVLYQRYLAEVQVAAAQAGALQRELKEAAQQIASAAELKAAVTRLETELLAERNKIKALTEELDQPLNVHRWRQLESSDPQRFELIRKIQTLQKQLIEKTEDVVAKDLLIQEKEKLYVELKNILNRQPGPEVGEQLGVYQQNLKQKVKQMKAMEHELGMYQEQVKSFKRELEDIAGRLGELQRRWLAKMVRRRNQLLGGLDED